MNEIYVDITTNQSAYGEMMKLKEEWEAAKTEFPQATETLGGVSLQLEMIGQEYQKLYDVMTGLLGNTADFIRQSGDTFVETDMKAAKAIKME